MKIIAKAAPLLMFVFLVAALMLVSYIERMA